MFTETIKPRFHETDALGHINNAVIANWFEGGRTSFFQIIIPTLNVKNWTLILAQLTINFHIETHFGKDVEVRSFISRIGNSSFDIYQEVWQNGQKTASGTATMVHYDYKTKKSIPLAGAKLEGLQEHLIEPDVA